MSGPLVTKLTKLAERHGLEVVMRPNSHVQVRGGALIVNWYPSSKRRTAYCNGSVAGIACPRAEDVIALAVGNKEPCAARAERKSTYKRHRARLWKKNPRCHWCGKVVTFEESSLDHRIPLSRGGANTTDNYVMACKPCNHGRGNELPRKGAK